MSNNGRNNEHDDMQPPYCHFHIGELVVEACWGEAVTTIPWLEEIPDGLRLMIVPVCDDHLFMIGETLGSLRVWGVTNES